jgi:hypothetical protein
VIPRYTGLTQEASMAKSALDEFFGVERTSAAVGNDDEFKLKRDVERSRFEEDEDDSLEEGSEETEEIEVENDVEDSEESEKVKEEIANLEKRVKDNRTAYLKEHELRLKLEKELEKERSKKKSDDDSWFSDDDEDEQDDSKDDPETEKLRREIEELKAARENEEKQRRIQEFESQEKELRKNHKDYDEMRQYLEAVYSSNKALQERFMQMGATAQAVYELGREVQAELDPEGYKQYLKQKIKREKAEKNKTKKKELNSLGSTSVSPKREVSMTRKKVSAVESIFGKK